MGSDNQDFMSWLVPSRSANQATTLELYQVVSKYELTLREHQKLRYIAQELAGICFSLWRAVFLGSVVPNHAFMIDDLKRFMENLILTNNVSFATDITNAHWSFRYYMSNATSSLLLLSGYTDLALIPDFDLKAVVDRPAKGYWQGSHDALAQAVKTFGVILAQKAVQGGGGEKPSSEIKST